MSDYTVIHGAHRSVQFPAAVQRMTGSLTDATAQQVRGLDALNDLAAMAAIIEQAKADTVRALRSEEGGAYSWPQIADALGMTSDHARIKYGKDCPSPRKVGGQPAHLR